MGWGTAGAAAEAESEDTIRMWYPAFFVVGKFWPFWAMPMKLPCIVPPAALEVLVSPLKPVEVNDPNRSRMLSWLLLSDSPAITLQSPSQVPAV